MSFNVRGGISLLFFIASLFIFAALIIPQQIQAEQKSVTLESIKQQIPDSVSLENKVVYVDFWASWCMPCRKSFPWMKGILEKYADSGLVIITINVDKKKEDADKFITEQTLNSTHLFDPEGKLAEEFALEVMPTSFLFDSKGNFIQIHEGFHEKESEDMEEIISNLIQGGLNKE